MTWSFIQYVPLVSYFTEKCGTPFPEYGNNIMLISFYIDAFGFLLIYRLILMLYVGDIFHAAPNIDHSQEFVRKDIKEWLNWLRSDIGFDGWRLDFVK